MQPMWEAFDIRVTPDHLGLLPSMLDASDPAPAREQFDKNYQHGGGWHPFSGFKMLPSGALSYPDDPPLKPLAQTYLRDERIVLYEHQWVVIIQPDGTFEVCRMD